MLNAWYLHQQAKHMKTCWNSIYQLPTWCTDYYLFIKYYSSLHVSSLKCSSSGGYSCIHAAYGTVTHYESSWWPVGTHLCTDGPPGTVTIPYAACIQLYPEDEHLRLETWELTQAVYRQATTNSHTEWQYHRLHVYNCILLKISTWGLKHVEENNILWINNNQCIKLVINI